MSGGFYRGTGQSSVGVNIVAFFFRRVLLFEICAKT